MSNVSEFGFDWPSQARLLVRGDKVGGGDGDTYILRTPNEAELSAALEKAYALGREHGAQAFAQEIRRWTSTIENESLGKPPV